MTLVPAAIGRTVARSALLAQKNSPGLLLGAGIVGTVAGTVLACKATLKMDSVVSEAKDKLDTARTLEHDDYSERDRQKDISLIYVKTSVEVVKLYAPAIIVGGIAIACLTRSHNILSKRNAGLTAAYTALEKGFNEYRARVVDKYGEDVDQELRYGYEVVEVGKGKKKELVKRVAPGEPSIYARFFDEYCGPKWGPDAEYNLIFLKAQQNYANDMLHARGHVFLNEVYDMLGIPRSEAGSVVGWLRTENNSSDNHVSFGVFDGRTQVARDFVNGREGAILLDFNVDGVIYDKIEQIDKRGLSWRRDK